MLLMVFLEHKVELGYFCFLETVEVLLQLINEPLVVIELLLGTL